MLAVLDNLTHPPLPTSGIAGLVGRPLWLEARSPFELRDLRRSPYWKGEGFPAGDGRPALLMPGFLASPRSTNALAHVMSQAGWDVHTAAIGRNAGPAHRSVNSARADLYRLTERSGQPATIIGHSRGGQFARILAVQSPDLVTQVIGLGTPLRVKYPSFFLMKLPAEILDKAWRWGFFGAVDKGQEEAIENLRFVPTPAHIDVVSIWSKTDGIVDWRLSVHPDVLSIEIDASHIGMLSSIAGIEGVAKALTRQMAQQPVNSPLPPRQIGATVSEVSAAGTGD